MASHEIMQHNDNDHDYDDLNEQDAENMDKKSKKRSKRPRYFPSNKPQAFIRNAVTGVPYPYVVGSKDQELLYKIVDSTGTCDDEGYVLKLRSDLPNFNTNHLFYDSPEQCMSHLRITIQPEDVKTWHENHQ